MNYFMFNIFFLSVEMKIQMMLDIFFHRKNYEHDLFCLENRRNVFIYIYFLPYEVVCDIILANFIVNKPLLIIYLISPF